MRSVGHLILLSQSRARRRLAESGAAARPLAEGRPSCQRIYWRGGVRYCSQYCYLEINGKRYCHVRESVAFPQGDPYAQERPTVEEIYRRPHPHR